MNREDKRYGVTLALGITFPALVAVLALAGRGTGLPGWICAILIVGSISVSAGLVAHEKGRSPWWALAGGWPLLLLIILFLPYTEHRRAELTVSDPSPAGKVAAVLYVQYIRIYGNAPSLETVHRWLQQLQALDAFEFLKIARDEEAQKRFISSTL